MAQSAVDKAKFPNAEIICGDSAAVDWSELKPDL